MLGGNRLCFQDFQDALKELLQELHISVPADKQMQAVNARPSNAFGQYSRLHQKELISTVISTQILIDFNARRSSTSTAGATKA